MSANTTILSCIDESETRSSASTAALSTILTLLRAVREHADAVDASDQTVKAELLDGVAMAELCALRILEDVA